VLVIQPAHLKYQFLCAINVGFSQGQLRKIKKQFVIYEERLATETNRNAVICFMKDKQRKKQTINYSAAELLYVNKNHDSRRGGKVEQLSVTVVLC